MVLSSINSFSAMLTYVSLERLARLERKSRFVRPLLMFIFTLETVASYTLNNLGTACVQWDLRDLGTLGPLVVPSLCSGTTAQGPRVPKSRRSLVHST